MSDSDKDIENKLSNELPNTTTEVEDGVPAQENQSTLDEKEMVFDLNVESEDVFQKLRDTNLQKAIDSVVSDEDMNEKEVEEETFFTLLYHYLISKEFLVSMSILVGFCILVMLIFFKIFLPIVTHHEDYVDVPDVRSKASKNVFITLDEAEEILKEANLKYEVIDSQYIEGYPPLAIISQEPVADNRIKPGRSISLVVNKSARPTRKLPPIIDAPLNLARRLLESWDLEQGKLTYKPATSVDVVLSASYNGRRLKEGDLIPVGGKVDLVVSQGNSTRMIEYPDFNNLPYDLVRDSLVQLGLMHHIEPKVNESLPPEYVFGQNPDPNDSKNDSIVESGFIYFFINREKKEETPEETTEDADETNALDNNPPNPPK